ncbi:PREDICTED: delta-like protein 4 isoform X2 [Acropora digitifera]|uniref:delta-like protein 4 isoform X2 n=1 Tax=Acropora digitifera TaxID=70779 RepID=UPI00077A0E1B|nr:PREDICTED: delta-like protein 4 isoform X2 [Acropora digitifera]
MKHIIATLKVLDVDLCELQCYLQPNCVSINFSVIPDSEGLHECELNNATHRSHEIDLQNKDGYVYKGAESACDRATCENGGTCQSGFTDKGYHCVCPPGFTSANCEQDDKMQHDGKETSSHNDDITNEDPTRDNVNMTLPLKLTSAAPTTVVPGDDEDENDQDSSGSGDSKDSESKGD